MNDTTTETQVPAWLNLDAFDLPAEHIATVREVNAELLPLVQRVVDLLAKAQLADDALEKATSGHNSDDVSQALMIYTGRRDLWALLGIMQSVAEDLTGCGGTPAPYFFEECERFGIKGVAYGVLEEEA